MLYRHLTRPFPRGVGLACETTLVSLVNLDLGSILLCSLPEATLVKCKSWKAQMGKLGLGSQRNLNFFFMVDSCYQGCWVWLYRHHMCTSSTPRMEFGIVGDTYVMTSTDTLPIRHPQRKTNSIHCVRPMDEAWWGSVIVRIVMLEDFAYSTCFVQPYLNNKSAWPV